MTVLLKPLNSRTVAVIKKALQEGLKQRKVIETGLYDWEGVIRPDVVAQLTEALILDQHLGGPKVLAEVKGFLRAHKLELRSS